MTTGRVRRGWACGSRGWATLMITAAVVTAAPAVDDVQARGSLVQLRLSGRVLPVASDLSVIVTVERDEDNRDLTVMVGSADYMRSSSAELEGADAARAHQFWFKHLPAGEYTLVARLGATKGTREIARSEFVVGSGAAQRR